MSIDWDAELLTPVMAVFGEGNSAIPATLPIYTPLGLNSFGLAHAVFDAQYEQVAVNPDDGTESTTRRPILGVRLALFPRVPAQNDAVFIPATPMNTLPLPGQRFIVRDVHPDGHGHAKLMLMDAAP
ncbi:MAG: hypothetical protein M3Y22_05865 [Pseudomonadota bacterium]|nr:hypothetical protein [Pseudomonadota bacterium]